MPMTEAAKEARRAYKRRWNAQNRDKQREYMQRYWERKATENQQETARNGNKDRGEADGNYQNQPE